MTLTGETVATAAVAINQLGLTLMRVRSELQ
jgi:hypothetical protein